MSESDNKQESRTVRRARRKLKKQLNEERQLITPEALAGVSKSISRWIDRHSTERIDLKEKDIQLFDENKNPVAPVSKRVKELRGQLSAGISEERSLKGRITAPSDEEEDFDDTDAIEDSPDSES